MAAVVTVTPAGAIDATYGVATLVPGAFVRAGSYERELSGKGVNVAAALHAGGDEVRAVVVVGREDLDFVRRSPLGGVLRPVAVPGATRVNVSVTDARGTTTKVNAPAPMLSLADWDHVVEATTREIADIGATWVAVCGTLPPLERRSAADALRDLIAAAQTAGARVALDTSGTVLSAVLTDPVGVTLIKPNIHELAELSGTTLRTVGDVLAAAREIIARGVPIVDVSMGADGVLAVTADAAVHAVAQADVVRNTAGAGDTSLAGFISGFAADDDLQRAALSAASWGALAVSVPGTVVLELEGAPVARLVAVDPAALLCEAGIPGVAS